jgi:hypothetical protein
MMNDDKQVFAFKLTPELAAAVHAAAAEDMCSASVVCRQALAKTLEARGFYRRATRSPAA